MLESFDCELTAAEHISQHGQVGYVSHDTRSSEIHNGK